LKKLIEWSLKNRRINLREAETRRGIEETVEKQLEDADLGLSLIEDWERFG
jgi:hypothetical protein